MEKELFYDLLKTVGHYKHDHYQDIIFKSHPGSSLCPNCNHGSYLSIQMIKNRQTNYYNLMRLYCPNCKNKWEKYIKNTT